MWELQGRVGSELSVCVTYLYLYIYIICMLQKQTKKRTPYHFKFNNAKKKIYGNVKLIVWLLGFFPHQLAFSAEHSSVVYQSKGPATFKVFGRLVLNEIWSDRC